MIVNWGDIYEVIYMSTSRTVIAEAFRRAVGLPASPVSEGRVAYEQKSTYADVDFKKLMGQHYGVRM